LDNWAGLFLPHTDQVYFLSSVRHCICSVGVQALQYINDFFSYQNFVRIFADSQGLLRSTLASWPAVFHQLYKVIEMFFEVTPDDAVEKNQKDFPPSGTG
jgi:hypothetical protein